MTHLLAVLGLAVACVVWVWLQQRAGSLDQAPCEENEADCDDCAIRSDRCVNPALRDAHRAPGRPPRIR